MVEPRPSSVICPSSVHGPSLRRPRSAGRRRRSRRWRRSSPGRRSSRGGCCRPGPACRSAGRPGDGPEVLVEDHHIGPRGDRGAAGGSWAPLATIRDAVETGLRRPDRVGDDEIRELLEEAVLDRWEKIAADERDRDEARRVVASGWASRYSIIGRPMASPVMTTELTPSASKIVPDPRGRSCAAGRWCCPGTSGRASPLGGAVHERRDHQNTRGRCRSRLFRHGVLGLDPLTGEGVDALAQGEEDVLLAPHDPLRHPGGAAGVEHVEIVGGSLRADSRSGEPRGDRRRRSRPTRGRCVGASGVVVDVDEAPTGRGPGRRSPRSGPNSRVEDDAPARRW